MKKTAQKMDRDTHIYMDGKTWDQLQAIATQEDRSVTATVRVLLREAMIARGAK